MTTKVFFSTFLTFRIDSKDFFGSGWPLLDNFLFINNVITSFWKCFSIIIVKFFNIIYDIIYDTDFGRNLASSLNVSLLFLLSSFCFFFRSSTLLVFLKKQVFTGNDEKDDFSSFDFLFLYTFLVFALSGFNF